MSFSGSHQLSLLEQRVTPLQQVDHPLFRHHGLDLYIKREDLIHQQISGNKWYKLKHNLRYAAEQGFTRLVSFGGAFSNHLHALAYAGQQFGFQTTGFIRGEPVEPLNPTLADMQQWGMHLQFLSRSDYRRRHEPEFVARLVQAWQPCFVIPEGGANQWALAGCSEIVEGISRQLTNYDYVCVPCGTGATLAGIVAALDKRVQVLGFSALRGAHSQGGEIAAMVASFVGSRSTQNIAQWSLVDEFHCGGFAKISVELMAFIELWQQQTGIALEPVYTGKMLMGLCELVKRGYFPTGAKIVAVHTGGMQGIRGLQAQIDRLGQ